jgi:hypothetical protein
MEHNLKINQLAGHINANTQNIINDNNHTHIFWNYSFLLWRNFQNKVI